MDTKPLVLGRDDSGDLLSKEDWKPHPSTLGTETVTLTGLTLLIITGMALAIVTNESIRLL